MNLCQNLNEIEVYIFIQTDEPDIKIYILTNQFFQTVIFLLLYSGYFAKISFIF